MSSLDNVYRSIDFLFFSNSEHFIFSLSLALAIGLFFSNILNIVIWRFPLMIKEQWIRESALCLQLDYPTVQVSKSSKVFSWKIVCNECRDSVGYFNERFLLLWLINKGRCRRCHCSLPCYFLVELFTVVVTVLVCWKFKSVGLVVTALIFSYLLIMLVFIDFYNLLLPDELTLLLLWLGLIFNLNHTFVSLDDAVIGAAVGYLFLWGFYWLVKLATGVEGLGYGDFKLMAALGAWQGWQALSEILLLGCVIGLLWIAGIYLYKDKTILNKPVPFGCYLSLAGLVILFEPRLINDVLDIVN